MKFGKRPAAETAFNNPEPSSGLMLSPVVAVIIISLVSGCMVGAYFLGFRAGHTNGLELALANNVSQVVRSPIAKSVVESTNNNIDTTDVYAKLKEPVAARDSAQQKQVEVSKEVKDFLQPTATPSSKLAPSAKDSTVKEAVPSEQVTALQMKKQADNAAIEHALNDAKRVDTVIAEPKTVPENKAVRVIGGDEGTAHTGRSAEVVKDIKPQQKVIAQAGQVKEDFSEPPVKSVSAGAVSRSAEEVKKLDTAQKAKTEIASSKMPASNGVQAQKLSKDVKETKPVQIEKPNQPGAKSVTVPSSQSLPSGWYSQIAAPRSIGEAQSIVSRLSAAGFKARIETAQVRDEKYFRVVVGPELNRTAADQVLLRLKKQTVVRTEPFIRMVR